MNTFNSSKHLSNLLSVGLLVTAALVAPVTFGASDHTNSSCKKIQFGQPPWTGASVKTSLATWMLKNLGYKTKTTKAALPILYKSIAQGQMNVMLAQWMPSERKLFRKFGINGSIDIVTANLTGGHYTLGVPKYVYKAGVTSIADLHKYKNKFGGKIYGIGVGSGGDSTIKQMISDNYKGLGDWKLAHSSTAAMLADVKRHIQKKKWIVFLAWSPHPMNINFNIKYLSGGVKYWGENKGKIIVNTISSKGYAWKCPNIGQFLANYKWTPNEQSLAMRKVINGHEKPLEAAKSIVKKHPKLLDNWFHQGGIYQSGPVKTADGKQDARAVIANKLGIQNAQ